MERKPQQIKEEGLKRLYSVIKNICTIYYQDPRKSEKTMYISMSFREQPKQRK